MCTININYMSEQEFGALLKRIESKLDSNTNFADKVASMVTKVSGIEIGVEHIKQDVKRIEKKIDDHVSWGITENLENKTMFVAKKDLERMYAPISLVKDHEELKRKVDWQSVTTVLTGLAIIGWLISLLVNFITKNIPHL